MSRTTVVFLIILAAAIAARVAYRWFYGRERTYRRRRSRENRVYLERMAEKAEKEDP
jgi:Flp pilus assembly protein TadB